VGISWGGKLAVALQRRHPGLVDGLCLLCPGFFARVRPPLRQRLAILWARLRAPRRLFPIPLNDPELFTATPRWQRYLAEDPHRLREATARLLIESVRLDGYLRVVPRHVRVPVLLLLAEHDRIIDNRRTRRFVEGFATTDKEIIEYSGAHHTLEFEPDPEQFLTDLRDWLDRPCTVATRERDVSAPESGG
jgi:alpha-beta hydrolase superfamily lysophospholipase